MIYIHKGCVLWQTKHDENCMIFSKDTGQWVACMYKYGKVQNKKEAEEIIEEYLYSKGATNDRYPTYQRQTHLY